MARKTPSPPPRMASLSIDQMRAALPKLQRRIDDLEVFDIQNIRQRWDPVVDALANKVNGTLQEILGHGTVEYGEYNVHSFDTLPLYVDGRNEPLSKVHEGYKEGIERSRLKLTTLKELFEERIADAPPSAPQAAPITRERYGRTDSRRVFVVHGHDDGVKETVARYLSKLGLDPIILHEQPNRGRTVIEKFEAYSDVAFAVVLFTPDDLGHPVSKPEDAKPRARQNVVLELGFFMAALGRERVCVLYKSGVEVPSDYSGVLYHAMDEAGAWRFMVAREMQAVGLAVDLNKAV
jgi:predicted nucleotide-binding protein